MCNDTLKKTGIFLAPFDKLILVKITQNYLKIPEAAAVGKRGGQFMENLKERQQGKIIGFLCIVCLILAGASMYFAFAGNSYRQRERTVNEKAVSSLCESLDSISVSLKKSIYSADKKALSKAGNELCRQAAAAKESLSLLSPDREIADELFKFLSQVGNYTLSLAEGEGQVSEEGIKALQELYGYASELSEGMNEICVDYYNTDVSFSDALGNLENKTDAPDGDFYKRVYDTAQSLSDYPTLVYDGPFADNIAAVRSDFLKEKNEVTAEEAASKIEEFLGISKGSLKREEDINGSLELYSFSKGKTDITVTKKGGCICSVLSDTYALEETISAKEAVKRGAEFLQKLGYENMKSSYYSIYDGICTVNYAYEDEGVICYGDLIKVSVSLDSGKAVALDATSFLLSHKNRRVSKTPLTEKEVAERLSPALTLIDAQPAFIPLDTGKEALCYELHCKDGEGQEVLVYLDAYTAEQRDILILLYSDGGVLTK
ncbi:MAG: hypothetical protein E7538_04420 [Ruminococcaceae bacterium]|nr:hypothetical protein [Oscillospiraceae bacterium]